MHVLLCVVFAFAVSEIPASVEHSESWPDAPKELNAVDQARADFAIESMLKTLASIRSGDVQVTQDVTPQTDAYALENRQYFDYDRGLERLDQHSGRYAQRIRAGDEVVLHLPRQVTTNLGTTKKYPGYVTVNSLEDEAKVTGTIPIDVRISGLGNLAHLRNHWTLQRFEEQIIAKGSLFPATLSHIDETDPIYTDLIWIGAFSRGRPTKVLLRLDRTRDFVPILNALFIKEYGDGFELISSNTAQWNSLDDTWVPVHWKTSLESPKVVHEFKFEWHTVNEAIEKSRFTIDDLHVPDGTPVINARIRDRVVVDRIVGQ